MSSYYFYGSLKGRAATFANRTGTRYSGIKSILGTTDGIVTTKIEHIKGRDVVVVTIKRLSDYNKEKIVFEAELPN